jgi:clan AA aspartic protease
MIDGTVLDRTFAVVPFEILQNGGQRTRLEVLIDTGFTGELTLPSELIEALGLEFLDTSKAELANGVFIESDIYSAKCIWHDEVREIAVMRMESQALIGMELLENSRLTIEVTDNGAVRIQRLADSTPGGPR